MSNSWFQDQRLAAGLTVTALARQLGVPVQTASRWDHGDNGPWWPWVAKLENVFRRTPEELIAGLWGETVGDSCPRPHGCGGTKILPNDPLVLQTLNPSLRRFIPRALKLLIKVPCAGCGRKRAYTQYEPHPKRCPSCSRKGERKKYVCDGYPRYGRNPDYGPSCRREEDLLPSEVYRRFKYKRHKRRKPWFRYRHLEDGKLKSATTSHQYKVNWARPFIDETSGRYRCWSCAFASLRFEVQKARLEEIEGDKIRSEIQHRRLWKEHYRDLTPKFNWQAAQERRKALLENGGKDRLYGERHRVATSRGRTIASWYDPDNNEAIVALCPVCDELNFSYPSQPTRFHGKRCYDSVRGQVRKGMMIAHKPGPAADNENLKRALSWAVRYLVYEEKLLGIATDTNKDRMFVEREIKRILSHLPTPDKAQRGFKTIVSLVREAAIKKGLLDRPAVAAS